jgi:hypothetical protein
MSGTRPNWQIVGRNGFAACPLGSSRKQVEAALGYPDDVFRRVPDGPLVNDYQGLGAQVIYDDSDSVVFVELASPADPSIKGVPLLGRPADDVYRDLRAEGIEVREDDSDASLPESHIGLYVNGGSVESVSAGNDD